jgi:hypothetical protein
MREIRLRYMAKAAAADIGVARAQSAVAAAAAAGALAAGNLAAARGVVETGDVMNNQ